ncbi:unnamed protein product [Soboliphyme baturini]|uniref:Uncharacterized protein n=1 Tax=Soboliphyme baturini TaxID=241478 RepID=A0A183IPC8_9BILA|nr:unnamed protein product [Soboliphyme baturini]
MLGHEKGLRPVSKTRHQVQVGGGGPPVEKPPFARLTSPTQPTRASRSTLKPVVGGNGDGDQALPGKEKARVVEHVRTWQFEQVMDGS